MVGKKTFNNILIILTIPLICLVFSCQICHYWDYDVSSTSLPGTYVCNQFVKNEIVASDTLVLKDDGTYQIHTYLKYHDMSNMDVFPTVGVWKTIGNTILLNSIFPCEDDSCFIKEIESDSENDDLIVIEMILLSTGMPMADYKVFAIYNEDIDSIAATDKSGKVTFPRNHTTAIDVSDPNGCRIIVPPRRGFIYRIYYRDCYLRIDKNQKLFIKKDTLLKRERAVAGYSKLGLKKYKTYEYPFVKIDEKTMEEEPCTTR